MNDLYPSLITAMTVNEDILKEKLLSLLGFAMRARKLCCGTDKVCDEIRRHGWPNGVKKNGKRPSGIVIIAADASDNTKKRIINACTYYNVGFVITDIFSVELSERIGKSSPSAVCAVFESGFEKGVMNIIAEAEKYGKH